MEDELLPPPPKKVSNKVEEDFLLPPPPKKKLIDTPNLSDIGQPFTSGVQTPLVKPSPLVSNLKSTSVTKPKQVNPFEAKSEKTQNPFVENKVSEYNPFLATVDEINNKVDEERVGKITQQQLDDNPRYQYLLNKKEAYERGYKDEKGLNGKTAEQQLFEDREPYLINKLDPKEQEEVKSLANYQSLMKIGKEKEAQDELQKYLNARSEWRKSIDDQIVEIKATLPNITDPTELQLAKRDIAELEIQKKPIYDPKAAMETVLNENANEVAQIAKPTETPKERLRKYTNSLYGSVLRQKERLGISEELNGVDRLLAERDLFAQDKGEELNKLHEDELKLKNAIKIYELNRTPYEKDTALGVFAKSFAGEIAPYTKSKVGIENTIASNIQSIVQDADIIQAANKEQVDLAKQYGGQYEFLSPKWAAQNLAPTAAIMTEMIPAAIATEGAFAIAGLGKLNRSIGLLSEYGKLGKASRFYFGALQDSKIGRGLIKSAFEGLKYGIESEAVARLAPQVKDEMGFVNGLFAGAAGKALGGLSGKMMEKILSSLGLLFGKQAPNAIRAIETYGNMIAKAKDFSGKVVGETAEEYVEQLVGIYKQSEGYNSFIDNLKKHYETTDALEEFATILMMSIGAPAGSTLAKSLFDSSKKMYNTMNRAERKVADQMADEIHTENKQAMETAVEETAKEEKIDLQEAGNKVVTKEEQRIKELEELTFDEETQQRLDIYKAKDLERYKKELTKAAYKTDEGSKIVDKHKAEDILANEKSTVAEIIMAKEFLADNTLPFNNAMLTDIQRNIDSQLSTVGKGQGKASWNDTLRRQKKIYDEVSQAQAKIDEEIKAETPITPSSSLSSEVSAPNNVEKTTDEIYADNAKQAFIDGKIKSFQLGDDYLYLNTNGVRVINGFKDNGNMDAFEASKVKLTKEEKKELRQIEADRELGEEGTGDRKRELAKRIFKRSLSENRKNEPIKSVFSSIENNEPRTIESNIPSSNKATQVAEPTKQEGETKVNQEEKTPIGETAETPTTKETKTDESTVFDDKNLTNEPTKPTKTNETEKTEISKTEPSSETKSSEGSEKKRKEVNPKVVKTIEQVLAKEVSESGELPKSATTRKNKRETALKEVTENLDAKDKVAVEHIVKNLDLIRQKLLDARLIESIDCKWAKK